METVKHKVLICSPNPEFLTAFRSQLDRDFDLQVASTEEISLFMAKDWRPQIALIDGDQLGNLTAQLRQIIGYHGLGVLVISNTPGVFKEDYAFRTGADHFMWQINDYKALVWRVVSLIRRVTSIQLPARNSENKRSSDKIASSITYKSMQIYPHDFLVKCNGRVIKITPIQFKLLIAFITHSDTLLTREWLKENIWGGARISSRSIDAQVSKLKKILPEISPDIMNIYGQGYLLTPEPKSA